MHGEHFTGSSVTSLREVTLDYCLKSDQVKTGSLVSLSLMVSWAHSIDELYRFDIATNAKRSLVWKGWFVS